MRIQWNIQNNMLEKLETTFHKNIISQKTK